MSKTIAVVSLLVFCTFVLTDCTSSQWITVRCPQDGVTIKIPRDVSASYRIYASHYESGYSSSLKSLRSVVSRKSSSDSLKESIAEFKGYLDKERTAIQTQLRKSVTRIQKSPCDSSGRKTFQILMENIDLNARKLRTIAAACRDTTADLGALMKEYRRDEE